MNVQNTTRDLALVGAGYWGKNLARNFNLLGALHTLCDQSQATLDSYQADYAGVQKTSRFDDVLKNPAIKKVVVAAPAVLHFELVKSALLAGKDVLVEKPLCLEARQGAELQVLAAGKQAVLMVGHLLQYHPCIQKLQAMIFAGDLGQLHYITSNRLNLGKIRREENALWSFAPHDISVILSLVGGKLPEEIRCLGESHLTPGVADTTLTTLKFSGNLRAHIFVSWLNPFKEQKLTVVGSEGMVVFDDTRPWNEKLVIHRHYLTWTNGQEPTPRKNSSELVVVPEAEPLREECRHFLECCQTRCVPRTAAAEGLRVLQVLQSAQHSLNRGGDGVCPSAVLHSDADYFVHPTALVDDGAMVGRGTKVWHFSHIMKGARLGKGCVLGQNVNVDGGTVIGNNVKIQNNVSIYTGLVIEDDVFLGPSCVFTNVKNPRSQVNRRGLYDKTTVKRGATIGANATIVCGVTIGRYAFIGAGAVVTKDVPDYAMIVGNPGRQTGWMSRHGHILKNPDTQGVMVCPESGFRYQVEKSETGNRKPEILRCRDLVEDDILPAALAKGEKTYGEFKILEPSAA